MDDYPTRMAARWAGVYAAGEDRWSSAAAARSTSTSVLGSLAPGSRILDVGAGRGIDAVRYAAGGHTVTGIDLVALPEWPAIEDRWPTVRFERCALVDHVAPAPYDVVVDAGCLHHQRPADLDGHLAAIRRLLRPGGTVWLATLKPGDHADPAQSLGKQPDGSYTLAFTESEISDLLIAAGFAILTVDVVDRGRTSGLDDLVVRATARIR